MRTGQQPFTAARGLLCQQQAAADQQQSSSNTQQLPLARKLKLRLLMTAASGLRQTRCRALRQPPGNCRKMHRTARLVNQQLAVHASAL